MFDNLTIKGDDIEALGRHLGIRIKDVPDITVGDLKDGTLTVESDASAKTRRKQVKDAQRAIKVGSPAPVVEAVPLQVQPIIEPGLPDTIRHRWKEALAELAHGYALEKPISKDEAEYVSGGDPELLRLYRRVRSDLHFKMLEVCPDESPACYKKEGPKRASVQVDLFLDAFDSQPALQKYDEFEPTRWTRFKRWAGLEKPPIPFGSLKGGAALLLVIAALASQADGEVMMASSGAALALQAAGRGMKDRDDALKVAGTSSSSSAGGSAGGGDRRAQVLAQLREATQKCQSFGTLDLVNNPLTNLPGWAIEQVLGQDHEASKTYWCQRKAQLERELTNLDALALNDARGQAQARGISVQEPAAPVASSGFGDGGGRAAGGSGGASNLGGAGGFAAGGADLGGPLNPAPPPYEPSLLERAACFFGMCLTPPAPTSGGFVQDTSQAVNGVVDNFFGNVFKIALVAAAVLVALGGVLIYTSGSTAQAVIPAVVPHLSGIVTAGGGAASQYLGSVGQLVQPIGQLVTSVTPSGQIAQVGDAVGLLKTVGGMR